MIAFIEFGRNNELASKIKSYHALAPVAYIGHIQGGLQVMSNFASQVEVHFTSVQFGLKKIFSVFTSFESVQYTRYYINSILIKGIGGSR